MPERQRMTTRLKTLFQRPELFVLAGGINPIGAKMAEALGYEAFYMSGGNTSAHQLGWPDSGTSMRDMVDNARKMISKTIDISVTSVLQTTAGKMIFGKFDERMHAAAAGGVERHERPPRKTEPQAMTNLGTEKTTIES